MGYRHYIAVDDRNRVTAGFSTGEHPGLGPTQGMILLTVDGAAAFPYKPLRTEDEDEIPLYSWDGETVIQRSVTEIEADRPDHEKQAREARIAELKRLLDETDYVVIKIAEGSATQEDYADVIEQRRAWRAEINELEG